MILFYLIIILILVILYICLPSKEKSIEGLRILGELSVLEKEYAECNKRCVDSDRRQRLGVNNFRCIHECDVKFGKAVYDANPINGGDDKELKEIQKEYVSTIDKCIGICGPDQKCRSDCYRDLTCSDLCAQECVFSTNPEDCHEVCSRHCTGAGYTI